VKLAVRSDDKLAAVGHVITLIFQTSLKRTMTVLLNVTNGNHEEEVLNSKEPVLVIFWAPWSCSSRSLRPLLETQSLPDRLLKDVC
jgi:thioredoxin-like negative regulator of GroEL